MRFALRLFGFEIVAFEFARVVVVETEDEPDGIGGGSMLHSDYGFRLPRDGEMEIDASPR